MMRYIPYLLLIVWSMPALSQTTRAEVDELKHAVKALLDRIEVLEAEITRQKRAEVVTDLAKKASGKTATADTMKIKGDFRYRYEKIDAESRDGRERNRIRARAEVSARPTDNLEVGIGIASGSADPISTNQTLGGAGSSKSTRLDLAYARWQATPALTVTFGKSKNSYRRVGGNGLIWDGDYRPEGVALAYREGSFFTTAAASFLNSDTKSGSEELILGLQGGFSTGVGNGELTVGAGYFDIDVGGEGSFLDDANEFSGNSFTCADSKTLTGCSYLASYREVELFAEYTTDLQGKPLSFFADHVSNRDVDRADTAWATGFKYGKANAPGTWEFGYVYQDIEADALFGALADSDFGGGGTDSSGHIFKGSWALNKRWKLAFTYFANERNNSSSMEEDYDRLQVDTSIKF